MCEILFSAQQHPRDPAGTSLAHFEPIVLIGQGRVDAQGCTAPATLDKRKREPLLVVFDTFPLEGLLVHVGQDSQHKNSKALNRYPKFDIIG